MHCSYIQNNFFQAANLLAITSLSMGGDDVQAGSTASACNLPRYSLKLLPTCECAAGLGPGTDALSGNYGCVPLPVAGPAPAHVTITYLSSTRARVVASLLSTEQAGIINVQMMALPQLARQTSDEHEVDVDTNGCPLGAGDEEFVLRANPACCLAEYEACPQPANSCSNVSGVWSSALDLDRNRSYALFSSYKTHAGVICTRGNLLDVDAMVVDSPPGGDISDPNGNNGTTSTAASATLTMALSAGLGSVFLASVWVTAVVLRRLQQQNLAQAREIQQLHDTVSKRFHDEVLKGQAKAAQARYSSLQCDRASIVTTRLLGEGHFGVVHDGTLNLKGVTVPVAVKQLKSGIDRNAQEEFLLEVWLTSILDHANIVRVAAVCTKDTPFLVALEYMPGGNLLNYVRDTQKQPFPLHEELDQGDFISIASQLCSALVYLEAMGVVHRDLAARNVLVGKTINQHPLKLSDFGMSRNINENGVSDNVRTRRFPFLA